MRHTAKLLSDMRTETKFFQNQNYDIAPTSDLQCNREPVALWGERFNLGERIFFLRCIRASALKRISNSRIYIYIYGVILSNIRVNYCSVRTMLQAKIVASLREAQRLSRAKNVSNLGRCKKNQCKKFFPRQQNFLQNLAQLLLGRQLFTFNICNIAEDTISHDFSLILTTNTHHIIETSIFSEYVTHAPTYVPESREKKYRRFGFNLV